MVASPQTEDGYTKIANELFDALLAFDFSKRQMKVLLYVIRKTYGYNKTVETMSYGQIAVATGMARRDAIRTVAELTDMGGLIVEGSGQIVHGGKVNQVRINKDYEQWLTSGKTTTSGKTPLVAKIAITSGKTPLETSGKTPTLLKKEEKKERKGNGALPCWLDPETWKDFKAHRVAIKKPMSDVATKRMFGELEKFRAAGDDPNEVLNQSIVNGWRGVYAVKRDAAAPRRVSLAEAMGEN